MPVDFLGRELRAGDTIVYPARRGSALWLNKLLVTKVEPTSVTGTKPDGRRVTIRNLKNVIIDMAAQSAIARSA
jgi:hypothetical protein